MVGRKVVAAMKRQAVAGEFRSNLHRGGTAKKVRLPPEYRKTALAAARVLGLRVAGVDMIESDEGPMVMEVNSSPGLEGIQKTTGVDVADGDHRAHRARDETGRRRVREKVSENESPRIATRGLQDHLI